MQKKNFIKLYLGFLEEFTFQKFGRSWPVETLKSARVYKRVMWASFLNTYISCINQNR